MKLREFREKAYGNSRKIKTFFESMYDKSVPQLTSKPNYWGWKMDAKRRVKLKRLIKFMKPEEDSTILDLGCGGGVYDIGLIRVSKSRKIIGLDISSSALRIARRRTKKEDIDIQYINSFGESIPLKDESIDRIFAIEVFEYLPDPAKVVSEISRILKPGGLVTIDNPVIPEIRFRYKLPDPRNHGDITILTIDEYKKLFSPSMDLVKISRHGLMGQIVELHNRILDSRVFSALTKNYVQKYRKTKKENENSIWIRGNSLKMLLEKYYEVLHSIDFLLLGWLPFQNSAFLTFRKR